MYIDITEDGFDVTKEMLKCPNAPQKSNGSTFGFKCCHEHVKKLIEKGLTSDQVDKYIDWKWCNQQIKKNKEKIESIKEDGLSKSNQKKIESIKEKNKNIEKILKKYKVDEKKIFEKLSSKKIKRRSPRKKTAKQLADYNECMQMENDNENLDIAEDWLLINKEKNLHPDQLQMMTRMLYNSDFFFFCF